MFGIGWVFSVVYTHASVLCAILISGESSFWIWFPYTFCCQFAKQTQQRLAQAVKKYLSPPRGCSKLRWFRWHASNFRRARIKIIICYSKSIRAAINRCLSNAPQNHTIGLTENSLQGKILRSQVRSPTTFPFGSERSQHTSVPRRCKFHVAYGHS